MSNGLHDTLHKLDPSRRLDITPMQKNIALKSCKFYGPEKLHFFSDKLFEPTCRALGSDWWDLQLSLRNGLQHLQKAIKSAYGA